MATCITCGREDLLELKIREVMVLQTHDYPPGHPDLEALYKKYGQGAIVVCRRSGVQNNRRAKLLKMIPPRKKSETDSHPASYPEVLVKELYFSTKTAVKARR